jgi:KaiC/GvpD/RAD55 family RecA-like ATPase
LEQSRVSLLEHMVRLNMDPRTLPETGIIVIDMTRLRKENQLKVTGQDINWVESIVTTVMGYKNKFGCDVLVLDSLAALYSLSQFKNPRSDIFFLFEKLRELGMTIFVISEMLDPDKQQFGMFGVEDFLADGIIHLDMERENRNVNLFMSVVKMRKSEHDRAYFPLLATKNGFEIVTD